MRVEVGALESRVFVWPDDLPVIRVCEKASAGWWNGRQRTTGRPTAVIRHIFVSRTIMIAIPVVGVGLALSGEVLSDSRQGIMARRMGYVRHTHENQRNGQQQSDEGITLRSRQAHVSWKRLH
jgi:hypothetical protein